MKVPSPKEWLSENQLLKSTLLSLVFICLSTFGFSQKELISKWERTFEGSFTDHYTLEIFYEKGADNPLTTVMKQNHQPVNHILNISDTGTFLFYSPYTLEREMFAELRVLGKEHRLYFNSGSLYMVRSYSKSDSTDIGK